MSGGIVWEEGGGYIQHAPSKRRAALHRWARVDEALRVRHFETERWLCNEDGYSWPCPTIKILDDPS